MKKILVSLMVLALCVPAMAATVTVTDGPGDGTGTITVTAAGDNIVGLGLDIAVTGANITAVSIAPATFNIYPDYAQAAGAGYGYGDGGAEGMIAQILNPGTASLPSASFAISAGMLNGAATAGADGAAVVTISVTTDVAAGSSCTVDVTENAIRGGIVTTAGANDAGSGSGTISKDPVITECVNSGATWYSDWLAFGSPDCWCYAAQCLGDVNDKTEGNAITGIKKVFNNDLTLFLSGYGVKEAPKGPGILSVPNGICADLLHAQEGNAITGIKRVFNNDLTVFLANYGVKEPPKGPGIGDCSGPDYNFFIVAP